MLDFLKSGGNILLATSSDLISEATRDFSKKWRKIDWNWWNLIYFLILFLNYFLNYFLIILIYSLLSLSNFIRHRILGGLGWKGFDCQGCVSYHSRRRYCRKISGIESKLNFNSVSFLYRVCIGSYFVQGVILINYY